MIFQDNVLKQYLKNVYFITGTPCGGKTTVTAALGKKYGIPVYNIDQQFTLHQLKADPAYQPNMRRGFRDADEFFGRSVEEYKNWLLGNSREQLDFILLDLIRLSQSGPVLCDLHIVAQEVEKITDPSRIAFLIKEPKNLVEEYCARPDHQPFRDFLYSATDVEKAKTACNATLYALNIDQYQYIKNSDYFWLERDNARTVEETAALVEQHFGWRLLPEFEICRVERDTPLARELLAFVENCSWEEVKAHLAESLRCWDLTDWEAFFVARAEGKIIGMASVRKEDYYPLPEIFPWVSCVFVSEEYRGQRVSGRLIAAANDYLRSLGFEKSYIPSGIAGLYERYGYAYLGEITNYGGEEDHLFVKDLK